MMKIISRKNILKSSTAAILLPWLEVDGIADSKFSDRNLPKRLGFISMGYGVNPESWFPNVQETGKNYTLPSSLKSFENLKSDFSVIQNLTNKYVVNGHTGSTTFLTCANTRRVPGVSFANSASCDQVAAEILGEDTRHSSLPIGFDAKGPDGHGGGLHFYLSWGRNGKPVGLYRKQIDLYIALFGAKGVSKNKIHSQLDRKKSSLDALLGHAKKLNQCVSTNDKDRIDEYFTSIRSIEVRLSKAKKWIDKPYPKAPFEMPSEVEGIREVDMKLTFDLMASAFQSDSTRVLSYMMPSTGVLKEFDAPINSHNMSHHGNKADWTAVQVKRDEIFSKLVSNFLKKLKDMKEFDGSSVLDHSLIAYGSALRAGHNQRNIPLLLAGHGGGGLKQGQNIVYKENVTPLSNLWLSLLRHVGSKQTSFADSTRVLSELGFV